MNDVATLPDEELPEHLEGLTSLQQAFVCKYVLLAGKAGKAARAAGFAESSADAIASRMLRNPKILHAISEEARYRLGALQPVALRAMEKLVRGAKSEHVRFEASRDILDRGDLVGARRASIGTAVLVNIDLS